jgi:molybdate transport system substrate-binding protein
MHIADAAKPNWLAASAVRLAFVALALLAVQAAGADTLTVAVASNFRIAAEALSVQFTQATGHEVRMSYGSTGKLHAQLMYGAPFDVFLAADVQSPSMIEASEFGVNGSRFTYALGYLVLWSAVDKRAHCGAALDELGDAHLAIANPETAPYGRAAKEYLVNAGYWEQAAKQLVYGENVAQALHFAATANARYALIAKAQAIDPKLPETGCAWTIPTDSYTPIEQQAVLLQRAQHNPVAIAFLQFLQSPESRDTIRQLGYGVP